MAFLREYDLRELEDCLILHFYLDARSRNVSMIICVSLDKKRIRINRISPCVSDSVVVQELRSLLDLFDNIHWKSYVNLRSIHNHPEDYGSLF